MKIKNLLLTTLGLTMMGSAYANLNTYATISSNYVSVIMNGTLDNDASVQILNGNGQARISVNQGGASFYCYVTKAGNETVYEDLRALSRSLNGVYDIQVYKTGSICSLVNNSSYRPD